MQQVNGTDRGRLAPVVVGGGPIRQLVRAKDVATITCTARDASGTTIPGGISIPDIAPKGHSANYLFPNLAGKRGTLEFTSNTMITALSLRVIGTDAFSSLSVQWK